MEDGERKAAEPNFIKVGWQPYRGDKNRLINNLLGCFITIKEYEFLQWAKAHYKTHSSIARCLQAWLKEQVHFKSTKGFLIQCLGLSRIIGTELISDNRE